MELIFRLLIAIFVILVVMIMMALTALFILIPFILVVLMLKGLYIPAVITITGWLIMILIYHLVKGKQDE